jgi:hypothetical protein
MPTEVRGAVEARKALRKYAPDLGKAIQKELSDLLKPVTNKARGFIPAAIPELSNWSNPVSSAETINYRAFPRFDASEARRGIGFRTAPSKPNRNGFRALARIVNASAAGAIYETSGRLNPSGRPQGPLVDRYVNGVYDKTTATGKQYSKSLNPNAGKQFIDALNGTGSIVDANNQTGAGRRSRKMRGRAIYRAWAEDGGKTNAAVLKALEVTKQIFDRSMKAVK